MEAREWNGAPPPQTRDLDRRIERDQGLREIARIGRNASIAGSEHGMRAIETVECRAAGARIALVALGIGDVAKVRTTGALQDIAPERRHVADLRACRKPQRLGDGW